MAPSLVVDVKCDESGASPTKLVFISFISNIPCPASPPGSGNLSGWALYRPRGFPFETGVFSSVLDTPVPGEFSESSSFSACTISPLTTFDFLDGVGRPVRFLFGDNKTSPAIALVTGPTISLTFDVGIVSNRNCTKISSKINKQYHT